MECFLTDCYCQVVSHSFATPWTIAHQAPLSMGFPREEYWSGLPFPSPRDLPDPETELESPTLAGRSFTTEPPVFVVVVQLLSHVWLFANPWTAARQAPLSLLSPGVCSYSCPLSWWCYPTISSSAGKLFCDWYLSFNMIFLRFIY